MGFIINPYLFASSTPPDEDLLLNNIPYATGAFGLRKLDKNYTGSCIKVRESGGDTLADIGFDSNGDLDTTALLAHTGGNSGYVHTWYDQSGLGYNATQTTNGSQPRIVNSGTVEVLNSKPSIYFSGSEEFILSDVPASDSMIGLVVSSQEASGDASPTLGGTNTAGNSPYLTLNWTNNKFYTKNASGSYTVTSATYTDTNQHLTAAAQTGVGTDITQWRDGEVISSSAVSSTTSTEYERIGRHGSTLQKGYLQEIIYYDKDRYIELTKTMSDIGANYRGWSDYSLFSTEFDGVSDYVDSGASITDLGITNKFTVSFWVKFDSFTDWDGIVGSVSHGSFSDGFGCYAKADGKIYTFINNYSSGGLVTSSVLSTGTWYHVLWCYDGTLGSNNIEVFIDGSSIGTAAFTATVTTSGTGGTSFFNMGRISPNTSPYYAFNGHLDEVAVWNTDKRADVSTIYNSGVPNDITSLSPTAWWRMGDESGYQYLLNQMSYSKYSTYFDGVDDFISVPHSTSLDITGAISISAWVKWDGGTQEMIVSKEGFPVSGDFKRGWALWAEGYGSDAGVTFIIWSSATSYTVDVGSNLTSGVWSHVVAVFKPSTSLKVYVNGSLAATNTTSIPATIDSTTAAVTIGRFTPAYSPGYNFGGNIDDVSVYSTDLSASDVTDIYNNGKPKDESSRSNLVGYWKMGENNVFPKIPNEIAYSKKSIKLDGIDDYVDLGDIFDLGTFSISTWIKADVLSGSLYEGIISKRGTGATTDRQFNLSLDTANKFFFWLYQSDGTLKYIVSNSAISTGTWYHVLAVADGSTLKLYIDGTLQTDTEAYDGTFQDTGENVKIGINGSDYFNGNIDDVAFYNNDQSSNAADIYNSGDPKDESGRSGLVGYWKMGDGDYFPTATDSSGNGNNGTIYNETGGEMIQLDTPNGWGTAENETAPEMIQGDTPKGNHGVMENMSQADIVQDAPT